MITHIPKLDLFRAECKALAEEENEFFSYNAETEEISYKVARIPVVYTDDLGSSVCLVRLITDDEIETFNALTTCDRIGTCEGNVYVFDSEAAEALYDSVYDQTPVNIEVDGETITYTPPAMIGVFA